MKRLNIPPLAVTSLVLACLFSVMCGCGRSGDYKAYTPAQQTARQALETTLSAWRDGKSAGKLDSPQSITAVDFQWQNGMKLKEFQILEEIPHEGPREFNVELTLESEKAPIKATYFVFGNDPLWVYRSEDFQQMGKTM